MLLKKFLWCIDGVYLLQNTGAIHIVGTKIYSEIDTLLNLPSVESACYFRGLKSAAMGENRYASDERKALSKLVCVCVWGGS